MIAWPQIKAALTSLMSDLASVPTTSVYWMGEAEASTWGGQPSVGLRVQSVTSQGIEEVFYEPAGLNDQNVIVAGHRRFTLSISVQSFVQDLADPTTAQNVAENISIRLMRPSTHARLTGLCAIEQRMPVKWVNYQSHGREVSAYVLDVLMRTVNNDVDDAVGSGDFINEVVIDGLTVDDAGAPLSPQPHLDVVGT